MLLKILKVLSPYNYSRLWCRCGISEYYLFLHHNKSTTHELNYPHCLLLFRHLLLYGVIKILDSRKFKASISTRFKKREKRKENINSHFVSSITPIVYSSWHSHNEGRHPIADQVEVFPSRMFALKHLHQHDIELHSLQEHPGEGSQEEEM